ncbi:uncharacterized protein V1518DRAFT_419929 [Limtongia smithiae]|uniref:uncharacterized protein n=1 Tax=Limtongia smithiae TaxID=1125753 RepID=UPI0034CDD3A4
MGSIGIPIKLLNESQGHVVTLELTSGQTYRGKLIEGAFDHRYAMHYARARDWRHMTANELTRIVEDNMNCQLRDITVTGRDGRVSHLEQVYIRGSHVRFFIVPDMLR